MEFSKKLYFSKKISKYFNKNIWIKFENFNLTGSHKDREVIELIRLAKSINANSLVEIRKSKIKKKTQLIKANDKDILRGFKLLNQEGIFVEGSACAIIVILKKIKKSKNICCVISGSAHKNLKEVQNIISRLSNFSLNY